MTLPRHQPIRLTRRDPARNMARFYEIVIAPTLFGEAALVRNCGRIGTRGRVMTETFPDAGVAEVAGEELARTKRRRGYRSRD
jgi:predicted DNA-binding WGR domain protein